MSTTRNANKQLRTLFRDGDQLSEQAVDDYVRLDKLDRMSAVNQRADFTSSECSRLAILLHAEDTGWITFLAQGEHHRVKVGFTRDPDRRISQLQSYSAVLVRVVAMVRAPADYAPALHRALKDRHSHGEWFNVDAGMADFMADVTVRRFRAIHEFIHRLGVYKPN